MAKLHEYKSYLQKMMTYHRKQWCECMDPYQAANCKQQYMAFKQAFEEFEHVLTVMGV